MDNEMHSNPGKNDDILGASPVKVTAKGSISPVSRHSSAEERRVASNSHDREYLNMLNNREGFGVSPQGTSAKGRSVSKEQRAESTGLVNQQLSPSRQAAHKQVGGRILQENEAKLVQVLEEN